MLDKENHVREACVRLFFALRLRETDTNREERAIAKKNQEVKSRARTFSRFEGQNSPRELEAFFNDTTVFCRIPSLAAASTDLCDESGNDLAAFIVNFRPGNIPTA